MNARNTAAVVRRCNRCGRPLPAGKRTFGTVCRRCIETPAAEKLPSATQRRCRRCREPIPMTQSQGVCKTCRHHGQIVNDPIEITCPEGHVSSVQSRHGTVVKCGPCWEQDRVENWITVRRNSPSANRGDGTT